LSSTTRQKQVEPCLQFFSCQPLVSLFQKPKDTFPIFPENCHYETNYNPKVDLMHRIFQQQLMNTTVCNGPEGVEQQMRSTFCSADFIVYFFRPRPNTGPILIPIHHGAPSNSPYSKCPQAIAACRSGYCSTSFRCSFQGERTISCKKLSFGCCAAMTGRSRFTRPLISFLYLKSNVSNLSAIH